MAVKNTIDERNFKIMVSKLHKKSAVYKSEGENFLKSICENVCFFPYSEKFF